jgi:2-amino-4-hydroxy-6-hydroxymethyldihydropteridine diphosphokinase
MIPSRRAGDTNPPRTRTRRYVLGLGGNLGAPRRSIGRAIARLSAQGVRIVKRSSLYETQPVGLKRQPWFVNQVIAVEAELSPHEMLRLAKSIEKALGRKAGPRNSPRTIDIDLLFAGRSIVKSPGLVIPHPRLAERNFVLVPLAEIAPRTVHPVLRKTIAFLLRHSPDRSAVVRLSSEDSAE